MREEEVEEPPRHKEEPVPPGHKGEGRKKKKKTLVTHRGGHSFLSVTACSFSLFCCCVFPCNKQLDSLGMKGSEGAMRHAVDGPVRVPMLVTDGD